MPSGPCLDPCQSSMARKLPGGQHVVTGVDPVGPHGPHSAGEVVEAVATKMEINTPEAKGVLAIMDLF